MSFTQGIRDRIGAIRAKILVTYLMALSVATEFGSTRFPSLEPEFRDIERRAAQMDTAVVGVVIGATLIIGFFVIGSISNALPDGPFVDSSGNTNELGQDKNSTLDRVGQGLLIGGVVIIVLFAGVILRVLRGL